MRRRKLLIARLALLSLFATASAASAQAPTFTKVFTPDTIGPGSVSTLTFTITNNDLGLPITDMAFTDVLPIVPGPVTIADPANASTDCTIAFGGAGVTAPDGGGTITFSDGELGAGATCTVTVDVTATAAVDTTFSNTTSVLTSDHPDSGTATDDLNVDIDRPGFSKSFAPSTVSLGGRSTLTFTIDNSLNPSFALILIFTDNLPIGLELADPVNASDTCNAFSTAVLTAIPGTSVISYTDGSVGASSVCTVTVDVIATGIGMLDNVSGELTHFDTGTFLTVSSGKASATLDVTVTDLALIKSFTDDPSPPGGIVTLEFTIDNRDRDFSATGIAFDDDLDATLTGLAPSGALPATPCNGSGSLSFVGGVLSFTGGTLAPETSCTFSVTLLVPALAVTGAYPNTTTAITGTVDGSPVVGNMASETLYVSPAPILTKTFIPDTVGGGDSVVVEFTVTNTSPVSTATDVAFDDLFPTILQTAVVTPGTGFCNNGSGDSTFTPLINPPPPGSVIPATLNIFAITLDPAGSPDDSCTFSITLDVIVGASTGVYTNTTTAVTATIAGITETGLPATDDLNVVAAPSLTKELINDPVAPGGTVIMEFTLTHDEDSPSDATGVTFDDDLAMTVPALAGLAAVGLPLTDLCGPGNGTLTGSALDTFLTFSGATLTPGEMCTFQVTLMVPLATLPGSYVNSTSNVSATVGGLMVEELGGEDTLQVGGITFTKAFTDDPVLAGGIATLEFTITNTTALAATGIVFNDNLGAFGGTLTGLSAGAVTPDPPCGAGSALVGTTSLSFVGGNLPAGTSCTFSVPTTVPGATADGVYINTTSGLIGSLGGSLIILPPATDPLIVNSNLLFLTKEFTDDPVAPGGTVNLAFTITNLDAGQTASGITFMDDLGATLTGLMATGLPMPACGGTLSEAGGVITLTGGSLGMGGMCTFNVNVDVPGGAATGVYPNTTGSLAGTIGGLPAVGDPALDDLNVANITLTKTFSGPTVAGGTVMLTFEITNESATPVADLGFTDDLDATLMGLVAAGLPIANVCGGGSLVSGTSFLSLTGGNLGANGSCMIIVMLAVPAAAPFGTYPNTTSDLLELGLPVAPPATDDLIVLPPPLFSKSFAPTSITDGSPSTLTFTIDNTASLLAASNLDFTDNLPAGLEVASPASASTTCTGGTIVAVPGATFVLYSGGTVGGLVSCTLQVDVTGTAAGIFVNTTGDLTSSSGNSGTAADTLTVNLLPVLSKVFTPDSIPLDGVSTLVFTIDHTAGASDATNVAFTDNLPAGMVLATPANVVNGCGGVLTAADGTSVVSLSGGTVLAGMACMIEVDVAVTAFGLLSNVADPLQATVGGATGTSVAAPAAADLFVQGSVLEIPTLQTWGLLLLAGLLMLQALRFFRRRQDVG